MKQTPPTLTRRRRARAHASAPRPTFGEMLGEVIDLSVGVGVALLPMLLLAVPGIILFVVLPAILLLALAVPLAAICAVIAAPLYLLARLRRRRRRGSPRVRTAFGITRRSVDNLRLRWEGRSVAWSPGKHRPSRRRSPPRSLARPGSSSPPCSGPPATAPSAGSSRPSAPRIARRSAQGAPGRRRVAGLLAAAVLSREAAEEGVLKSWRRRAAPAPGLAGTLGGDAAG